MGKRTFLAPEVIQTSLMDCGPAALKAALQGFGIEVHYDLLRERCATDVDGTAIDSLAGLAEELGLGGTEMVVPHDSFLLEEAACLPAIVVQRAGGGALHFVLVWNTLGPLVQVMDPGSGRYWTRKSRLLEQMPYIPIAISIERWRRWIASEDSLAPLRTKARRLGVSRAGMERLLASADEDPGWRAFAALDAAVRMVGALVEGRAIRRGREAERLLEELHQRAVAAGTRPMDVIPRGFWWATPDPDPTKLTVHAALIVHFAPRAAPAVPVDPRATAGPPSGAYRRALSPGAASEATATPVAPTSTRADDAIPGAVRRELLAARVSPSRVLGRMLWSDAPRALLVTAAALVVATAVAELDVIVLRGLFDVARHLTLGYQRVGGLLALAALVIGGAILDYFVTAAVQRFGVRLEMRLRVGFAEKLPLLEDHYLRSRPTSDMTSRAHAMHSLRDAPALAARIVRAVLSLAMTAAGVIWIFPGGATMALAATALCVALPHAFRKPLFESSMRLRTHAAALERFYLDALIGVVPVRLHGAERAVRREHEELLVQWTQTARTLHGQTTLLVAVQSLLSTALAVAIVANFIARRGDPVGLLLLVFWSLRLPTAGQELVAALGEARNMLNAAMRLFAPLGARELAPGLDVSRAAAPPPARGVSIELVRAGARAGGHALLRDVSFRVAPGEHVAIVGASGAGKSTLLGVLLGWLPTEGTVRVDDQDLDAGAVVRLREQTAWVDPAVHIWNRSLLDNVTFGAERAAAGALPQAMSDADLLDVLERLPDGWQTQLGDGGGLVSGGQGQRVRLARALMRQDARLVLLDEPFRGLEHERRRTLLARARQRWSGATLLLVSHDVADTLDMDRVLVVDDGTIVEDGAPRALLADPRSRFRALATADRALLDGVWSPALWRRNPGAGRPGDRGAGGAMIDWCTIGWPAEAAGAAMIAASRAAGLAPRHADLEPPDDALIGDVPRLSRYLECAAHLLGIESEPIACRHHQLRRALASLGSCLVRLRVEGGFRWLAVASTDPQRLRLVTPAGKKVAVPLDALHAELTLAMDAEPGGRVDKWLERARVPRKRALRARRQLVDYLLAERAVEGMWLLREDPGSSFPMQLRRRGLVPLAARFVLASVAQVALSIAGWVMIARGALQGVVEAGWLAGWALLCLSAIPLQAISSRAAGELGVLVAARLKQRLLCGALRMRPGEVRARGSGGLLALVSESQAIDGAGFSGALRCVTGLVQLAAACAVLVAGAGGWLHVAMLAAYAVLIAAGGRMAAMARDAWTQRRFELTNRFVENVIGNRTRVVQQRRERHHARDDAALDGYLHASQGMDRWNGLVGPFASRGWVALALLGLVHATVTRDPSVTEIAIAVAGILQAALALSTLVPSLQLLLSAGVAYRSVGALFRAASQREEAGVPQLVTAPGAAPAEATASVLAMHGVSFQFRTEDEPVIASCDLDLRGGDRVLLEGASGEGKSTLASLASGLLTPSSGLVLLHGMDRRTVGSTAWRQRVASAPQFHENHILSGTLAFNLLMGRAWPAAPADVAEAETLCRRLGLGAMLDRMPSRLGQVVGETGWQLSHGERSRVFLARALLQHADVVILDECFGALDPETLARCVAVVREYAPTLMVIAHP